MGRSEGSFIVHSRLRIPWGENLVVGKTSFGFLSVKFMLIATLKAEKMYLPAGSYLLVPVERSGCDIWDVSGTW